MFPYYAQDLPNPYQYEMVNISGTTPNEVTTMVINGAMLCLSNSQNIPPHDSGAAGDCD